MYRFSSVFAVRWIRSNFVRIRILGSGFENSDPDPVPTFLAVRQKKGICMSFLTKCKHLKTLKIKDLKKLFRRNGIYDNFI